MAIQVSGTTVIDNSRNLTNIESIDIVEPNTTDTGSINFSDSAASNQGYIQYSHTDDSLTFGVSGADALFIARGANSPFVFDQDSTHANISFFRFNGSFNAGQSSYLQVNGSNTGEMGILFGDPEDNADGWVRYDNSTRDLIFGSANSNAGRFTSLGYLGIGTSSPDCKVHVYESSSGKSWTANSSTELIVERAGDCGLTLAGNTNSTCVIRFGDPADEDVGRVQYEHDTNTMRFVVATGTRATITSTGLTVNGALSKTSGSFKIDHPLKPNTHHLVHSFVEAPQADNIYRGRVTLASGQATVNLDEAGRMTEGTFVALNGNVQCFTSNESGWTALRGRVEGNILTIEAQDSTCTDEVSWLVIGERHDQHMIETDWTDETGRVITEPEKEFLDG